MKMDKLEIEKKPLPDEGRTKCRIGKLQKN